MWAGLPLFGAVPPPDPPVCPTILLSSLPRLESTTLLEFNQSVFRSNQSKSVFRAPDSAIDQASLHGTEMQYYALQDFRFRDLMVVTILPTVQHPNAEATSCTTTRSIKWTALRLRCSTGSTVAVSQSVLVLASRVHRWKKCHSGMTISFFEVPSGTNPRPAEGPLQNCGLTWPCVCSLAGPAIPKSFPLLRLNVQKTGQAFLFLALFRVLLLYHRKPRAIIIPSMSFAMVKLDAVQYIL